MGKLHVGDFISLGTWIGSTEDLKVSFNLLVDTFCFTVGLEVIGGGEGEVIIQEFPKLLSEGGGKLWAMIGDDLVVEPKSEVYLMEKEGCYSLGSDGFLCGAENYPLCKAMVDYNQQRVETRGSGEVGDKVTRDLLEGARGMRSDWGEQWDGGVGVGLILLACGTAFDILSHKLCKA